MIVQVRLFARAKDLAGADQVQIELGAPATVATLRRRLVLEYPRLKEVAERSAIAVNEEFAHDDLVLGPGVTVALLPPVSGGQ